MSAKTITMAFFVNRGPGAPGYYGQSQQQHHQQSHEDDEDEDDDPTVLGSAASMARGKALAIWGNVNTLNINPLIVSNIQASPYFKVQLLTKKTYHEVVDEIYYKVEHMEPWERGSRVS